MEEENLVVKRTFEDTLNAQEELRDTLETLIKENRCLTEKERGIYFRQLAHATFGLGRDIDFDMEISKWLGVETFGNVEYMARRIAMKTENSMVFKRKMGDSEYEDVVVPISKLWCTLLYALFDVFPLALDRASAMSKEYDATVQGEPYEFKPKK